MSSTEQPEVETPATEPSEAAEVEPTEPDEAPERPGTAALECVLFTAKEPITLARIAEVLQVEPTAVIELLQQLSDELAGRGVQVLPLAGGYTLGTRADYAEYVTRFLQPDPERLSLQALETLAIIAYRQPITRPEVDEVRGVNSSGTVTSLLEKDLIRIAGRRDAPGRPFLLETTPHFLSVFGLGDLDELPDISELKRRLEQQLPLAGEGEALGAADEADPEAAGELAETDPDTDNGTDGREPVSDESEPSPQ
jgi:segregation and condensation protein B